MESWPFISGYFTIRLFSNDISIKDSLWFEQCCERIYIDYNENSIHITFREYVKFDRYDMIKSLSNKDFTLVYLINKPGLSKDLIRYITFNHCKVQNTPLYDDSDITTNDTKTFTIQLNYSDCINEKVKD